MPGGAMTGIAMPEAATTTRHLLILGGTGEAAGLARGALARVGDSVAVTTALAGRTRHPGPVAGQVRIGGFGGAAGLAGYLIDHQVDCLIDATHPFAAAISRAARLAAERTGVPRSLLLRPPWRRDPLDRWIEVDGIEGAARLVGRVGRRAWLTVGAGAVAAFAPAGGVHFVVRLIDRPRERLPLPSHEVVLGRGPFSLAEERRLIERHAIDVIVCKASGGAATEAKLIAARERGLPVIMVRRPPPEPGCTVETVEAALDWLAGQGGLARSAWLLGWLPGRLRGRLLARLVGGAGLALLVSAASARADLSLFGAYFDNVARAAAHNDAAVVRQLVTGGSTPNQLDENGRTGLQIAAINGNLQIAAILIKAAANLNLKDRLGNTALHYATDRNHFEMAQLLLDVGAAVDPDNKNGMTPLMVAASRGNVLIVQALLAKGANMRKVDFTGRDALGWAAESRRPAVVQALQRAAAKR